MKKIIYISLVSGIFFMPAKILAQLFLCPNLNFAYGTMQYWQSYTGSCAGGNYTIEPSAQIPGRHTIMNLETLLTSGQLNDEQCNKIEKVPKGYRFSCRIGNDVAGSKVDAIEYEMTVDSTNSLLILSFAWVMQKCGSGTPPQFTMKITDSYGNILNIPCGNVNFTAQNGMTYLACETSTLVARNWDTFGISLEQMIGQKIKIYFETKDCTAGSHYGYAYIVGECRPMRIDLAYCSGTNVARLRAPDGFMEYTWTRTDLPDWIDNRQQVAFLNPNDSAIVTCVVKSEFGCEYELKTMIVRTKIDANFMFGVKDEHGHVDFDSHGNQSWYDTCLRTVSFVDMAQVYNSKKNSIYWDIHGVNISSRDSMFTYTFPCTEDSSTTYLVRLTVSAENGCMDTGSQHITIYNSSHYVNSINAHFTTQQKVYCNYTNIPFSNRSNVTFSSMDCECPVNLICEWDWGDGSKSIQTFLSNTMDPIMEHSYNFQNKETEVIVTLKVKIAGSNHEDIYTDTLTITQPIIKANFADFGYTLQQKRYCNNTNITFTNQSRVTSFIDDSECPVNLTCEWDWGDGSKSIQTFVSGTIYPVIEHRYNFPNEETEVMVSLTVKITGSDQEDIYTDTLTILQSTVQVNFTDSGHIFPCVGEEGRKVSFTNLSEGEILHSIWDFGDSSPLLKDVINPTHTYTTAGIFTVTLAVEDSATGCVDIMQKENHVFINDLAGTISYTTLSGCISSSVTFTPTIVHNNIFINVDSVIYSPDGVNTVVRSASQVNNSITFTYTNYGQYIPYFQLIKWVSDYTTGKSERCIVDWYGADTILIIELQPNFITDSLYGLDAPIEFENTTIVNPTLLPDSIHWNYGNNDFRWIYNTHTESHNGYTTYDAEGTYCVTLTEYYKLCNQSKNIDIKVSTITGITKKGDVNADILIFPNPASTQLYVKRGAQEMAYYTIYNVVGQIIMQGYLLDDFSTINIEPLAKGMYYLRVLDKVRRFVKE